jgi:hypothetical protein
MSAAKSRGRGRWRVRERENMEPPDGKFVPKAV